METISRALANKCRQAHSAIASQHRLHLTAFNVSIAAKIREVSRYHGFVHFVSFVFNHQSFSEPIPC